LIHRSVICARSYAITAKLLRFALWKVYSFAGVRFTIGSIALLEGY